MKTTFFFLSASTLPCLLAVAASAEPTVVVDPGKCDAQQSTQFALEYGEPLQSYERTFRGRLARVGINEMLTSTQLASPQQTATVKPNFDTLYMSQCFDVGSQDIVFTIGDLSDDPDRFWSASFYTPYGDNYLNVGNFDDLTPGDFLITPANSTATAGTLQESEDPRFKGVVFATNTIGFLLIRIVLRDTDNDLPKVQEMQRRFKTVLVDRPGPPIGPELSASLFDNTSSSQAEHVLELTSRFIQTDPLWNDTEQSQVTEELSNAGVHSDGAYHAPECVDLGSAYKAASTDIAGHLDAAAVSAGNGWVLPPSNEIGMYDGNYTARATIARWGYFAMTPDVALYPRLQGLLQLQPNESYTMTFHGKPPVLKAGFWSVTMYDNRGYLVENPVNRYAIGDRSNLTYPDGAAVYGNETGHGADDSFSILIQGAEPPAEWVSNWLPSPNDTTQFELMLRFYLPDKQLLDLEWEYPVLRKGSVVRATGGNNTEDPDHESSDGVVLCKMGCFHIIAALVATTASLML